MFILICLGVEAKDLDDPHFPSRYGTYSHTAIVKGKTFTFDSAEKAKEFRSLLSGNWKIVEATHVKDFTIEEDLLGNKYPKMK